MKMIDACAAVKGFFFSDRFGRVGDGHLPSGFVVLLGFGIWLLSHPYWGIWHDARVYTLMAIRWLNPEAFARDPWFMFGSQDAYSVFSPIYGSAIALFGVNAAAKWGSFLGGGLYVGACWLFSRVLPLRRPRDLVFLLLVSVPLVYCINDIGFVANLRVSESFITSRQFAIAFGIVGVSAEIAKRYVLSITLLFASAALHPLMAVWPILAVLCKRTHVSFRSLVVVVALGSVLVVCLSAYGLGIFRPIEGEWGELTRTTGRIIFMGTDESLRLDFVLVCYSILFAGAHWGELRLRRWYRIVLLLSISAYTVNWICSSHFPAAIVMQAQLWRANWFALLWSVVAVVDLAMCLKTIDRVGKLFALGQGGILLSSPVVGAPLLACAVCGANKVTRVYRSVRPRLGRLAILTIEVVSVLMLGAFGFVLLSKFQEAGAMLWRAGDSSDGLADFARGFFSTGGYGALATMLWFASGFRILKVPLAFGSIVVVALAMWQWDERAFRGRQFDEAHWGNAPQYPNRLFVDQVKPGQVVYWQGRVERVWFELGTASYASSTQAIGIVFSERMAFEVARRLGRVALAAVPLPVPIDAAQNRADAVILRNVIDKVSPPVELSDLHSYEANNMTLDGLRFICEDPELDLVIDDEVFRDYVSASVSETVGSRQTTWNLYDCARFREAKPVANS